MIRAAWGLAVLLAAGPAAQAKPSYVMDGHDWQYYLPEQKVRVVTTVFAMLEERGVTMNYHPLFYALSLNWYYIDGTNLDVDLGNALADIADMVGEWAPASPEAVVQ